MDTSSTLNDITQLLGIAFISALFIERVLQMLKALLYYKEAMSPRPHYWNMRAATLTRRYLNAKRTSADLAEFIGRRYLFQHTTSDIAEPQLIVDANHVRQLSAQGRFKVFGVILGVIVAFALNLNLIDLVEKAQYGFLDKSCLPDNQFCLMYYSMRDFFGQLIMGIGIGLGATPLHQMIARLESAYKTTRVIKG